MEDKVEVPTTALAQVIERLTERRIAVEKAVNTLGEAPSGLRDVFELCRGFERAFTNLVNDSDCARKIKEAFFAERGLAGTVDKLPLERVFELDSVKKICKTADGYQPHMVSPEKGLRLMASKALDQVEGPVEDCVQAVYALLVQAARDAAEVAGEHTEAAMSGKVPLNVPEFKNFIMPAIVKALDDWKQDALRMAKMQVDMERSYITAGFFRYTMTRRYEKFKQQEQLQQALNKQAQPKGRMGQLREDGSNLMRSLTGRGNGGANQPSASEQAAQSLQLGTDAGAYLAAFFDKKVNEESARSSMPVDGWRWQKRFFVFSDQHRHLYYFKSPDDVPKPNGLRGQVDLADAVAEDLDETGRVRTVFGSAATEMERGDRASLLLRLRSKDVRRPIVKDHNTLTLKAPDAATKYEWLFRLDAACKGAPAAAPAAAAAQAAAPGAPAQAAGGSAAEKLLAADSRRTTAEPAPAGAANSPAAPPSANGGAPALEPQPSTASNSTEFMYPVTGDAGPQAGPPALDRRNSFDMMGATRLGQGAKYFRAEECRDDHGTLLPAPAIVLGGVPAAAATRLGKAGEVLANAKDAVKKHLSTQETWEMQYERLVEQFASDMNIYMRSVCDTINITVPKSVVHCLVRKAEKNLLNHMFNHVHRLSEEELKRMLQEDESVVQKRLIVKQLFDKVKMAIDDTQYMAEKIKRKEEDRETVLLQAEVLALAAMTDVMTGDQRRKYDDLIRTPYLPEMRPPVPLSHMSRPKKLPTAPAALVEEGGKPAAAAAPQRTAPTATPRTSGGGAANGAPAAPPARRAPPPPPKVK